MQPLNIKSQALTPADSSLHASDTSTGAFKHLLSQDRCSMLNTQGVAHLGGEREGMGEGIKRLTHEAITACRKDSACCSQTFKKVWVHLSPQDAYISFTPDMLHLWGERALIHMNEEEEDVRVCEDIQSFCLARSQYERSMCVGVTLWTAFT